MGYVDGWLKLRLKPWCKIHFVWSTKEKLCFCNTIKFTENIFFLTLNGTRKHHNPSPSIAILVGPTVFPVKIL